MSGKTLPALGPDTVVRLSRQGGFAALPHLAAPREIDFSACDERQRGQVCSVLERCLPVAERAVGGADQRFFQVELRYRDAGRASEWILTVPEQAAPGELVELWQRGPGER